MRQGGTIKPNTDTDYEFSYKEPCQNGLVWKCTSI